MKSIWKTIIIVSLCVVVLGILLIGVALITGADFDRIQDLFNSTYNVSSFSEYYTGIVNNLLGIQPLA